MMRSRFLNLILGGLLLAGFFIVTTKGQAQDMKTLQSLLTNGTIVRIQVLHVPNSTLSMVGLRPDAVRRIASNKAVFDHDVSGKFDQLLAGLSVEKVDHAPDLRWGVLFLDSQDHEVASLFVDKFGQYGYLNGETVSFKTSLLSPNLAKRLHQTTGIPN